MSWRTVVITQHAKLSYSGRMMIVQTDRRYFSTDDSYYSSGDNKRIGS